MNSLFFKPNGSFLNRGIRLSALAVLFLLFFAGCEEINAPAELTTFEDIEIEELAGDIANDLGLTRAESQEVNKAFANHRSVRRQPGYLWLVAGDLQKNFTEEQIQRVYDLIDRYESYLANNGKFMFFEGWPSLTGKQGGNSINCRPTLTEDQLEKMKEIREAYAARLEKLKEKYRAGRITEEEYRRSVNALMEALQKEFFSLLTEEQIERWRKCLGMVNDIFDDHRSEAFRVMVRVLGLTREQHRELVTVQQRLRSSYNTLIRDLNAGNIDREEFIEGLWNLRNKRDRALADLFDQRQYEIVKIHQALIIRKALNQFNNTRPSITR